MDITKEQELIANEVADTISKIEAKYKCKLGVWLTWRDLIHNFDKIKAEPDLNELHFGLHIRFENEPTNKIKKSNRKSTK